jgi:hypothetical protein
MTKPIINSFSPVELPSIHRYKRYLPTAFDESLSILQKVNKTIKALEALGEVSTDVITQWNEVMTWVMDEGLTEDVTNRINDILNDGTFTNIINNSLFKDYNSRLTTAENKINGAIAGTPKGVYQTLTDLQTAYPTGTTGIYVVRADGNWYYWNSTAWTIGGSYLAAPIGDWSIGSRSLSKQRAELVDMGGSVLIDYGTPPSVIFNADSTGRNIFAMTSGYARQINIPVPSQPYTITPDGTIETFVVQYLVVDNTGTPSFKRWNLILTDDFIIGLLYNNRVSLFYSQENGRYVTGEILTNDIRYYKQAKKIFFPKGLQITYNQNAWYANATTFFDISTTENARYFAINQLTNEVVSLLWKDVKLLSRKMIVFGVTFKGQVYIYGKGFMNDAYDNKKGRIKDPIKLIEESIKNPFVRTNTKLIGDSIVSGTGGTGFSETGTLMFTDTNGTTHYENVTTATCWANMMRQMLQDYSGNTYIEPLHKGFYWSSTPILVVNSDVSQSAFSYRLNNVGDSISFVFYGDHFDINFGTTAISGMVNVIVDGVIKQTIDLYSVDSLLNVVKSVTGLSLGYHTVVLEIATNRNADSTGNRMYFNGITVNKTIGFKNWGIAGVNSLFVYANLSSYIETTDDLYILQLGTNDRKASSNWQIISMYQRKIVEAFLNNNADVVIMTANSGEQWNEESSSRLFHSNKVADENMKLANEYNLPYISNYNAFLYYTLMPNADYTDLMDADGTHPNDKGHKLMFRNICEKTGLNAYIGIG